MKSNTITIKDSGFQSNESKEMIIKMINNQINNLKLEHLSQWVRNHSISRDPFNKKIEALKVKKKEIEGLYSKSNSINPTIELSISLELKVKEQMQEPVIA